MAKYLFFIYLCIFPFGQLGRRELSSEISLHLVDLVVGAIATIGVLALAKKEFRLPPLAYLFLTFLFLALLSLLVNFATVHLDQFLAGSFYFVRLVAYTVFYFVLWNLFKKADLGKYVFGLFEVIGLTVILFGFVQYFFLPDFGLLEEYGWDPHLYRLAGSFLDTGFAGILIVLFLLANFSRLWGRVELFGLGLTFLGIIALALTYSRASYLAYFAGLLAIHIVRRNLFWLAGGILALLVIIPFLPQPESEGVNLARVSTVNYRVNSYRKALEVISQKPLFGVGYNLYRYTQGDVVSHGASGPDSSLLFIFATTGMAGILLFGQIAAKVLQSAWEAKKTALGVTLFASLVALGVHSIFDNSLFYPWVLGWVLILLAATENTSP